MNQPPETPVDEQATARPTCWWHPGRETGLRCTRCDRPACPDCLREASVGYQCIDCVQAHRRQARSQQVRYRRAGYGARTVAGARVSRNSVVTLVLIGINLMVYLLSVVQAGSLMQNQSSSVMADGVLQPAVTHAFDEWWRLLTSGFLHYGLIHIAVNMLALWVLGRDVEVLLGKWRYLALYFVSMLGGSAAVYLFEDPARATAGASGAIYGLLGGLLVALLRMRLNPSGAIGIIVINLILSITLPNISLLGHLGGLVAGALVMAAMVYAPRNGRLGWQVGAVVGLTVALAGLILLRDAQLAETTCGIFSDAGGRVFDCR